jgi:hypothetical protein
MWGSLEDLGFSWKNINLVLEGGGMEKINRPNVLKIKKNDPMKKKLMIGSSTFEQL